MTTAEFWAMIAESRRSMRSDVRDGNMDLQEQHLDRLLDALSPAEVLAFSNHFGSFMDASYDYDLWAVAYILAEGLCSDDWFDYFRAWLVSMGQAAYESALQDPLSVEHILHTSRAEDIFFEEILYVPGRVYERKTGQRIPYRSDGKIALSGRPWRSDDEVRERFPELYGKYLGGK